MWSAVVFDGVYENRATLAQSSECLEEMDQLIARYRLCFRERDRGGKKKLKALVWRTEDVDKSFSKFVTGDIDVSYSKAFK